MSDQDRRFFVLLGGDYAGKSAVMESLGQVDWTLVRSDDPGAEPPYDTLADLRNLFVRRVLPRVDDLLSPDYVLSGLQMSLVYLRDRVLAERPSRDVLVDSYYYKILAKCALTGLVSPDIFRFWRSFPRPDRILYLCTSAQTAWQRALSAGRLNRFEHYGPVPSQDGFVRFQRDLSSFMRAELGRVPIDLIDGDQELPAVRTEIEASLHARPGSRVDHGRSRESVARASQRRTRALPDAG